MVGHRINLSQLITLASTAGGMNGYFMASIKDDDGTYRSTVAVPYVIPYRGDWPSAYQVQGSVNTFWKTGGASGGDQSFGYNRCSGSEPWFYAGYTHSATYTATSLQTYGLPIADGSAWCPNGNVITTQAGSSSSSSTYTYFKIYCQNGTNNGQLVIDRITSWYDNSTSNNIATYNPWQLGCNHIPDRLFLIMQGAGGGGAGSSSYYGGGAGGICVCILNIRQLKETGGCFKIGLAPGAIKQSQGGNSYLKYNTSRTASSGDVTICTAGGGNPGETSSGGGGGTYSWSYSANGTDAWAWKPYLVEGTQYSCTQQYGGHNGVDGGGITMTVFKVSQIYNTNGTYYLGSGTTWRSGGNKYYGGHSIYASGSTGIGSYGCGGGAAKQGGPAFFQLVY